MSELESDIMPCGCCSGSCYCDDETPSPRCLQAGPDCHGKVEYHLNPDRDDFKTFARCEHHQAKRLESAEESRRKYPTLPPSDFDPAYAGERWDEDE